MQLDRRDFMKLVGIATLAGTSGLAGCITSADTNADPSSGPMVEFEPNYRGWFDDVGNYRGTVDVRGRDEVTVTVGSKGDLGYFKFDPPAIAVSPGTSVVWTWSGKGGPHNVVAAQGAFDSGDPVERAGHTFEHTFDTPAVYKYVCEPHEGMGMKGAVFVALGD